MLARYGKNTGSSEELNESCGARRPAERPQPTVTYVLIVQYSLYAYADSCWLVETRDRGRLVEI